MIENIGIDIVENKRIEKSMNDSFINIILTDKEKELYKKKTGRKKIEFLAGRFAAKEAVYKAISSKENPNFHDVEILNRNDNSPYVIYKNYNILISISHENKYTIAEAIVLK